MLRDIQFPRAMRRAAVVGEVSIRLCRAEDLAQLEWFGMYTHHREILQDTFARHRRGEVVMKGESGDDAKHERSRRVDDQRSPRKDADDAFAHRPVHPVAQPGSTCAGDDECRPREWAHR